jgi:hypothetical protein
MMGGNGDHSLGHLLRMGSVSLSVNHSIEPIVLVGHILNPQDGTVGFMKSVLSLDNIPIASLMLRLNITGMVVLNAVLELVLRMGLKNSCQKCSKNSQKRT